jgi:hypothetical protein
MTVIAALTLLFGSNPNGSAQRAGSEDLAIPALVVPKEFGQKACEAGVSSANRYRQAWARGWQSCLKERSAGQTCSILGNGWPSEAKGYMDGSDAASVKFDTLARERGGARARDIVDRYISGASAPKPSATPTSASDPCGQQ